MVASFSSRPDMMEESKDGMPIITSTTRLSQSTMLVLPASQEVVCPEAVDVEKKGVCLFKQRGVCIFS